MISSETIDRIKSTTNIVDVIESFIKIKRNGSNFEALCPFHIEKTPSFKISQEKGIYKCFGCGVSGDAIKFLNEYQHLNYIQAIEWLADKYKIPIQHANREWIKPQQRQGNLSADTITYFKQRGISESTLNIFGITETVEWMPKADSEVRAVCFNYFQDGKLINIKFRAKDKDYKLSKNSKLIFYNLDAIADYDFVIIVEGEIDCLSIYEAGNFAVISVPNGAESKRLEYLDNCWQYFENKNKVILFTDNDQPGIQLRDELARRIGKDKCWRVEYPADTKDANDILIKYGSERLLQVINEAKRWPIEGILTMDDLYPEVCNYYLNGYPTGFDTGIGEFDEYLTFMLGQYTTVTGAPGSGKSEFIDYISTSLARKHDWKFAVCSFENPAAIHVTKLMEKFIGFSFSFRKDQSYRMNKDQFEEAVYLTDKYFQFINIGQIDVSIQGILLKLRELVIRTGIKGIILDPWNYIEHKIPDGQTETQYVSECLTLIKEFCLRNDVHLFLIAHPRKLQKDQKGQYPVPTMYDISGSAHFFNKTDNGISLHRDFQTGVVDVYIQKVRFSWLGKLGFVSYNYNTLTRQYL